MGFKENLSSCGEQFLLVIVSNRTVVGVNFSQKKGRISVRYISKGILLSNI